MLRDTIVGHSLTHSFLVQEQDCPIFIEEGPDALHPVLSTYALAREAEWAGRKLLLLIKREDEQGIGTSLSIEHKGAAAVGATVVITATCTAFDGKRMQVSYTAHMGNVLVAEGSTGQALLPKEKLDRILGSAAK